MSYEPDFIPTEKEGKNHDQEFSVDKASIAAAVTTFQNACTRLRLPGLWHGIAGMASAKFNLCTPGNIEPGRLLEINDYVSIIITGPAGILGEGADWVRVDNMQQDFIPAADESFGLTLRACANPNTVVTDAAHFFETISTSTFLVKRTGTLVTINFYGRNEKPNTHTISVIDNVRNAMVAAAAVLGLSNLQWTALCKGLLSD